MEVQTLKQIWNDFVKQSGDDIYTNRYIHKSESKEAHYREGYWAFSYYILNPVLKLGISPESTVLEIGCGLGRLVIPASYYFTKCFGIDISEEVIFKAQERVDKLKISNIKLLPCDGQNIPLEDKSVNFVYSFLVLMHIPSKKMVRHYIKEIYRVLKPEGLARIQVRRSQSWLKSQDYSNITRKNYDLPYGCSFTKREIKKYFSIEGLKVLSTSRQTRRPYNLIPSQTQLWVTAKKGA